MEWFNLFGLIFIMIIMIPNIIFAIKQKDGFENKWHNKAIEIFEQIGRFGCFGFMIINIPSTYFGFLNNTAFVIYIIVTLYNSISNILIQRYYEQVNSANCICFIIRTKSYSYFI